MRRPAVALLLSMVFLPLSPSLASANAAPPAPSPLAPVPIDLDPWLLGDAWTYDTAIEAASSDGTTTSTQLTVTLTVSEVRTETVGNLTYSLYNASSSGSASSSGVVFFAGANPFSVAGTLTGWSWFDRSNLASVAVNQTTNMTGVIQVGIFTFPLIIDASTTVRNTPALEEFDFPLELGDEWSFDGIANSTGAAVITAGPLGTVTQDLSGETNASFRAWFNATEDVNVPAGLFPGAARVHATAPDGNATDRWYHPDAKNFVKMEVHRQSSANDYFHLWSNLTAFALVPPPWPGSITLNPSRVAPGGSVVASGAAMPNEDLEVSVPATGATYTTRADGTGSWSVAVAAPAADDFTPANADLGSHGVLVEPATAPPGWDVATLQLVPPDLYVAAGDLTASDPSPLVGASVTLNGTVRAASVGVTSPFNVSFSVDGSEVSRTLIPQIAANGSAVASTTWIPNAPGVHSLTFTADPDGEVRETDETNNSAVISILVRGPDLTPWNLAIEAEANATYGDPSAANFTSAPIQGRIGGTVNVTFEAASVGAASSVDAFEVEVIETVGLRGPPRAGWRFSANVTAAVPPGARAGPWTAAWSVPPSPGFYYLNVTIDAADQVSESFEGNNTFAIIVAISGPDYLMGGVMGPVKVSAAAVVSLSVEVRNGGQLEGGIDVPLAAYEGTSPTPFHSTSVASLTVGENVTVNVPWNAPSSAAPVELRLVVDPSGVLEEMDESNNEVRITIDVRGPPVTTISFAGPNVTTGRLYVRSLTQFSLTGEDFSGDGLSTYYRLDAGATTPYASPFVLVGSGAHTIGYRSEDRLGGVEVERTLAVEVDDAPPTTTFAQGEVTGNRTTVSLSASDGAGAGVGSISYRVDNGTWQQYAGPFLLEGFGQHVIEFHSTDLLGNEAPARNGTVTVFPRGIPRISLNLKPLLAAAFAAILLVFALIPRPPNGYAGNLRVAVGIAFAAGEAATGIASLIWRAFEIQPNLGASPSPFVGIGIDVGILVAGILAWLFIRRRFEAALTPPGNE